MSKAILLKSGLNLKTCIIVCKPYMAKRAWAAGVKQWPEVKWFINVPKIEFEKYPSEETPLKRMINLMVGDIQRLKLYAEQGFQVEVQIPNNIWEAYKRLVKDGYVDFVI